MKVSSCCDGLGSLFESYGPIPSFPTCGTLRAARATGETEMANPAALIAVLIMERPLCVACIASRSKLTTGEVESYLNRIEGRVAVLRGVDRCRACFASTTVCSLIRRD
jgi:hypothetical protein